VTAEPSRDRTPVAKSGKIVGYTKTGADIGEVLEIDLITPEEIVIQAERILQEGNK
jgi:hypothetical protein